MSSHESWKSDVLRLGLLAGLCLLIGGLQVRKIYFINPDGIFYINLAQRLPGDYVRVAQTYPPGYPLILRVAHQAAALCAGPGSDSSAMFWLYSSRSATILCRMLALIPLYFLGKLLLGAGSRSFWALVILLVLSYPAEFGADVLRDWPYVLFLSLGFWLLCWGLYRRQWWVLALVGLAAGLGYLIRPECIQLVLYGWLGLACVPLAGRKARVLTLCGAGSLLAAGFLVPALPNVLATGFLLPHQLRPFIFNRPPVIRAIGPTAAGDDPLEFEVAEGERLELPIHATDPDGDRLTFSLTGVPVGSRPVYEFWSMVLGRYFWTMRVDEKNHLLSHYPPHAWSYERIAFYAYARPDARTALRGVHRYWSPARRQHFYTWDERERETILQESPPGTWDYEGIAFYAFGEAGRPQDTVPVYRCPDQEGGYSWEVAGAGQRAENKGQRTDSVAWYVHPAGTAPSGAAVEDGVLRWRPGAGQEGQYQINVIVGDGERQDCQLVQIKVRPGKMGHSTFPSRSGASPTDHRNRTNAASQDVVGWHRQAESSELGDGDFPGRRTIVKAGGLGDATRRVLSLRPSSQACDRLGHGRGAEADSPLLLQHAGLERLPRGIDKAFDGVCEDLMVVFFVPWLLGLYQRLRYQAARMEQVLIPVVILVHLALILGRQTHFGSGDDRRYALGMIALTIFYVPVGIEVMARWLDSLRPLARPRWMLLTPGLSSWFYLLVAAGIVVCLPKLVMTPRGNKAGYRAAVEWFRRNTKADAVLAVPDDRISFYAQRKGLFYAQHPNTRRADYIVMIEDGGEIQVPEGWRREYSVLVDRRTKKNLVIYSKY